MALQYSVAVNNARLDAIETTIGATAILRIRTGAQPATCATADAGTVLATLTLPADWMSAAAAGAKAKLGTWQDTSAEQPARLHTSASMTARGPSAGCRAATA